MNSDSNSQSERQGDDYEPNITAAYSQQDYPYYLTSQNPKYQQDKFQNDFQGHQIDNSLQEEESKDEESYQENQTQQSAYDTQTPYENENLINQEIMKQYQTQNVNSQLFHNMNLIDNSRDKGLNVFSNSFDESAPSFDLRPQRNCKSSTRMMNKTQKRQGINTQIPIPILQNMSSGVLTAGSLSRKQAAFNNYMRSKQQIQSSYQQTILNQMHRLNTQNSFDMKQNEQDLSNRSVIQNSGGQSKMNNSFYALNHYLYGTTIVNNNNNKPITPSTNNQQAFQSVILSAGSSMNPRNGQAAMNQSTMDPYTYLRWKQQKYKSCRSIQASNGQIQKQCSNQNNGNQFALQQRKGNQTQKNNKSTCSSNGSAFNTSTTTMTGPIKALNEVKNPQYFISFRFNDRKLNELDGINQFKNLSELDISGNLLTSEIVELKQLQFLKKLNLSNNTIKEMYPLPGNLEILNLSYNQLKNLKPEITMQLKNLSTLDIGNNGLETLEGIQNMKRLKRLLSKNNQITDLKPLSDLETIIELDIENNPIDTYAQIFTIITNKKDILVLNLKLTPVMLTVTNQDQLFTEIQLNFNEQSSSILQFLKKKLKFFNNGCLFRSKRVFNKIKILQQTSKRSSSNFSNGSSSCGRAGVNTGGRGTTAGVNMNINNSTNNAFSPLLNNNMSTPGQGQRISQRLEDIELVYDEILDEEEELERKINKIQKKKAKKNGEGANFDEDSCDEDEDESIYDEDDIQPTMSFEDDIDELHSYRNNNIHQNEFLNESTADFNKEIRQINQELRDQLNNENEEHLPGEAQSLNSTQTLNTNQNRKNPISFKLDLSKCTQQQSEEEDDTFGDELQDPEGQLDIPGLQFVKVTDDSFRQFQKQQSLQQSVRTAKVPEKSNKSTLRDYPPKPIQKQVFIPKLQLGVLQQNCSMQQNNIPLKHPIQPQQSFQPLNSKSSLQGLKSLRADEKQVNTPKVVNEVVTKEIPSCQNEQCMTAREELKALKSKYENEKIEQQNKINELQEVIEEIRNIFDFRENLQSLTAFIRGQMQSQKNETSSKVLLQQQFEDLSIKYNELEDWKQNQQQNDQHNQLIQKCEENEKTISKLQEKLQVLDKQMSQDCITDTQHFNNQKIQEADLKRVYSTQCQQNQSLLNNPQYFYNDSHNQVLCSDRVLQSDDPTVENLNNRSKKKQLTCDIRKVKRPSSQLTTGARRSSQAAIKINNLLKLDPSAINNLNFTNIDDTSQANDYSTSNLEYDTQGGDRKNFSQTMNKKVGHYIQRLKERNSSLQERLNGSFGNSGTQSALQRGSPIQIKLIQKTEPNSNPYILSPNCENLNTNFQPSSTSHQNSMHQSISSFSNNLIKKISSKDSYQKHIPQDQSNNTHNEYSTKEALKQHSKTQRIHVNRIQYNQMLQNKNDQSKIQPLNDNYQSAQSECSNSYQLSSSRVVGNDQSSRDLISQANLIKGQQSGNNQAHMYNRQSNNLQL